MKDNIEKLWLNNMETAPQDGTHVIIKGSGHDCDFISFYEAWWWKPDTVEQWERGSRPHWEYVCSHAMYKLSTPLGWIPLPLPQ